MPECDGSEDECEADKRTDPSGERPYFENSDEAE